MYRNSYLVRKFVPLPLTSTTVVRKVRKYQVGKYVGRI